MASYFLIHTTTISFNLDNDGLHYVEGLDFRLKALLLRRRPRAMLVEMDDVHATSFSDWRATQPTASVVDAVLSDVTILLAQEGWYDVRPATPAVLSLTLPELRTAKLLTIDAKTTRLIAGGFVVSSKTFSASDAAQLKWLGMYTSRTSLTYPVLVPTKDDSEFVELADAAAVETYYNALLARVQAVLTGGTALKQQIAAAASQVALDAIVDDRT
jgi:hypothetical protein